MGTDPRPQSGEKGTLLRVRDLRRRYARGGWLARNRSQVEALRGVDLEVRADSVLALIGASGSGKSTLARCLACLEKPDSGEIWFAGRNLVSLGEDELIPFRRQIQLIFQDPATSLNPRLNALEIVSEPLRVARLGRRRERQERALELMELVGLSADWAHRLPFEFSGGQRRRLALARALALEPKLLILDEALTGLDLSVQAQVANLLLELQAARALTYLCISHDLSLVTHLADEVGVFHDGRVVEAASVAEWLASPRSPQGRELLAATVAAGES
jgi:peptide/nickel transport system ATP-binding protein